MKLIVGDMSALPILPRQLVRSGDDRVRPAKCSQSRTRHRRALPGVPARRAGTLARFHKPINRIVCSLYLTYLTIVGSIFGWTLHRDPDTYRYIPASLRRYPAAQVVVTMLEASGFVKVVHFPVLGGLMSIHRAFRP